MNKDSKGPPSTNDVRSQHLKITTPSSWVTRFQHLVTDNADVLDVAAGNGRHGRQFIDRVASVTFIDRDITALKDMLDSPSVRIVKADLEMEISPFATGEPLSGKSFDAVIVVNYLHRPLLNPLTSALRPGGVLIYDTFARGNEKFARPRNPDHLLKNNELLSLVSSKMHVVAYEAGRICTPDIPGVKQRICAVKHSGLRDLKNKETPIYPLKDFND